MTIQSEPSTKPSSDIATNSHGTFILPEAGHEFDEIQKSTSPLEINRAGASKDRQDSLEELAILDSAADVAPSDYPMLVWLQGDEPWFADFNMDADAVMKTLGIKRSRLTQISGRDLRVGRVRVDRYIRPVYRDIDVKQYLIWTRATASHQKSSDSIRLATSHLQEQSQQIQSTLDSISSNFTESLRDEMSSFIASNVSNGLLPLELRLDAFQSAMTEMTSGLSTLVRKSIESTFEQLKLTSDTIQESARMQSAALEILALHLNKTSEKAAAVEERLASWDNLLTESLNTIGSGILDLKKAGPYRKTTSRKFPTVRTPSVMAQNPKLIVRSAPTRRKPK